jgi:hypothetical protein
MGKLKELSLEEKVSLNGGGFREIGRAIGRWIDSWNDGTKKGCGTYDDSLIPGSASNNYIS